MTAGDVVLKVTPEMLTEKADLAEETLLEVQRTLESLEQTVKRTRGYWLGSAGELHRKMYEDEKTAAEEILRRLQSHLRDLHGIAGTYRQAEENVRSIADSLPVDILR
ncbi:MAG: WXG100 family type VII secretion target [Lachnospiraceae bacterium]|jgi:WXG100 family type VII secretion target|nr:WXG100 family type VII secretion target [Lachnospiraceae bacterium]